VDAMSFAMPLVGIVVFSCLSETELLFKS